ncbi:DeoR family transcriptional regulator [Pseudoduganella lurida]|uniref:DeoR family transcriptional regulator n=1 Tax=Pseudoduganella lurida TaxID=1036180 RepID=A0A562RDX6_9BURK|nr:DeoR/GlpR family DNA-binding transcription regulator [Pseudoduganella lurida]TWI67279.1 DeoR family transcriptional regulator [Pseudoduganella lurida]
MAKQAAVKQTARTTRPPEKTHLLEERRRLIVDLVNEQEQATVDELSARFGTSVVTIRSDLKALEEQGALVRTHGGALAHRDADDDVPLAVKESRHHPEKMRIAAAAVALIRDGDTLILDSGTTTAEIAKLIRTLKVKSLNVITNALNIAVLLANAPHVQLIMLGGQLRSRSWSLSGPQAEAALEHLHADWLFLGVDCLDPEVGLMTPHLMEAQLNARMIRSARQVVAVADSSKLLGRNLSVIARVDALDRLITDRKADHGVVDALQRHGVEVVLV